MIEEEVPVAATNKKGDFRTGHIPGAIQINYEDLFVDADWKTHDFKDEVALEALFTGNGLAEDDTLVVYCHSGRRVGYLYFALDLCGYENAASYEESFKIYNKIAMYLPLDSSFVDSSKAEQENDVPEYLKTYFDLPDAVNVTGTYKSLLEEQIED